MDHKYYATIEWTGNRGTGTSGYTDYDRSHTISVENKIDIAASADPHFRGDPGKYNPEDLFLISIASCHMLWYLHLCADNGIIVERYTDKPFGLMQTEPGGTGQFSKIELHPAVVITDQNKTELAASLHHKAHEMCFLSRSVNFEITIHPEISHS
jgi:organic hydroperoxide reductase OsmC/OhrA